ncbi:isopeptide-forming domain-containing fimbrial protein [Chloroflexota bacterium]
MNRKVVRENAARGLIGILLVLGLLQSSVPVLSDPPGTWTPPLISKGVEETEVVIGDPIEFTVVVNNPASATGPDVAVPWYEVVATDVISPGLAIDLAVPAGTFDAWSVVGNTVVVTASELLPGEWFSVDITCTLVSPVQPWLVITNTASLEYEDETGDPGARVVSDPVPVSVVGHWLFLPIVFHSD